MSTVLLGTLVNWLSAVLAVTAILFYVFVYTLGLKRRTPSNIVIGGAAGCFPVLIGWSAVTGRVSLPAVVLFAVIFFWTPPHFWALAMKFRDDYAAARVPMLPVVASPAVVARKILFYSYVMVLATLALAPYAGWLYTAAARGARWLVPGRGAPAAPPGRRDDLRRPGPRARSGAARTGRGGTAPAAGGSVAVAARRAGGNRAAGPAPVHGKPAASGVAGARARAWPSPAPTPRRCACSTCRSPT